MPLRPPASQRERARQQRLSFRPTTSTHTAPIYLSLESRPCAYNASIREDDGLVEAVKAGQDVPSPVAAAIVGWNGEDKAVDVLGAAADGGCCEVKGLRVGVMCLW